MERNATAYAKMMQRKYEIRELAKEIRKHLKSCLRSVESVENDEFPPVEALDALKDVVKHARRIG
jgi:hypothetical protein